MVFNLEFWTPFIFGVFGIITIGILIKLNFLGDDYVKWKSNNVKLFNQPVTSQGQYLSLLILNFVLGVCSTFYTETMGPFWYSMVDKMKTDQKRKADLCREFGGNFNNAIKRFYLQNLFAEIWEKISNVLWLFLSFTDIYSIYFISYCFNS